MSTHNSIILVMLVTVKSGQESVFADFAKQNSPLLAQYHITPIKSIAIKAKGQIAGINDIPQPNFISIFRVSSLENFKAYMADERYADVSALRAKSTSNVIGYFAHEKSLPKQIEPLSPPDERLYMVGFATFINGDDQGLERFNNAAIESGLFSKHGMYIEYQLAPFKAVAVVGDASVVLPERIQIFFINNSESFKAYVADPLYKELSPLRDKTLTKYDFFAGGVK